MSLDNLAIEYRAELLWKMSSSSVLWISLTRTGCVWERKRRGEPAVVGDAQVVERGEQQRAGTGEQGGAVGRRSVQVGLGIGGSALPGASRLWRVSMGQSARAARRRGRGLEHGDIISRGRCLGAGRSRAPRYGHRLWSLLAVAVRSVSIRPMLSSALSRVRRAHRERPR
jgi:hypothetical protein